MNNKYECYHCHRLKYPEEFGELRSVEGFSVAVCLECVAKEKGGES